MDDSDEENLSSYQDTGWDDDGCISVASLRPTSTRTGPNGAPTRSTDPGFGQPARNYARAEMSMDTHNSNGRCDQRALQPHPTSLEADGVSLMPSVFGGGPDVPYSSHLATESGSSRSHSPVEEASPNGSPGAKLEEFAPNSPFRPSMPSYRDRRYQPEDINLDTFRGRLASFYVHNWSTPFMDKRDLARLGFYYEGDDDEVICMRCNGSLSGWQPGDDPWVEHHANFGYDCFGI